MGHGGRETAAAVDGRVCLSFSGDECASGGGVSILPPDKEEDSH